MRPTTPSRGARRGTITVIVVSFLGLMFILGMTFVFYSIAEADAAKVYRDSSNGGHTGVNPATFEGTPPEPDALANMGFGQLIYGPPDGLGGAFSALRNQEMARTIYGWDRANPLGNTQAFNGVGLQPFFTTVNPALATMFPIPPTAAYLTQPTTRIINASWHPALFGGMMFDLDNNYAYNPKTQPYAPVAASYRAYSKSRNATYPDVTDAFLAAIDPTSGRILIPSFDRPWLMKKNMATGANDQTIPYGTALVPGDTANPNPWLNAYGALLTLRPRPVDHIWPPGSGQSEFPYPEPNFDLNGNPDGTFGDIENLPNKASGPQKDSIWVDLDAPVRTWRGKNYKPLFAFLVLDLDGRINLSTAGNFYQDPAFPPPANPVYKHYTNMGVGPWEVNPSYVMIANPPVAPMPAPDIQGAALLSRIPLPPLAPPVPPLYAHHKFGGDGAPNRRYRATTYDALFDFPSFGPAGANFYGPVDFSGRAVPTPTKYHQLAVGNTSGPTSILWSVPYVGQNVPPAAGNPARPNTTTANSSPYDNGTFIPGLIDERTGHPAMFNPYLWSPKAYAGKAATPDRNFGFDELRLLNAKYNSGDYRDSEMARVAPYTLGNQRFAVNQLNARFATTPVSTDLWAPGASPWLQAAGSTSYNLNAPPANTPIPIDQYPIGQVQNLTVTPGTLPPPIPTPVPPGFQPPDYDNSYRARLASQLGPVDVNRKLTDYRTRTDLPLSPTNVGNYYRAVKDRFDLARDIFERLLFVTTGTDLASVATLGGPQLNAARYLAQLAVNIVDYIDADDMITPFNWNPAGATIQQGWVYGNERPRLVINETYHRFENDPMDMGAMPNPANMEGPNRVATMPYKLKAWLELHNPVTPMSVGEQNLDPMGDDGSNGGYRAKLAEQVMADPTVPGPAAMPQSAYRILVYKVDRAVNGAAAQEFLARMQAVDNPTGELLPANLPTGVTQLPSVDFADPQAFAPGGKTVQPNTNGQVNGPGFYLCGPASDAAAPGTAATLPGNALPGFNAQDMQANLTTPNLDFDIQKTDLMMDGTHPNWSLAYVLQRRATPVVNALYNGPAGPTGPLMPAAAFNPWITVDYVEADDSALHDSLYDMVELRFDGKRGALSPPPEDRKPNISTTFSWGRRQPHDARMARFLDFMHHRQGNVFPPALKGTDDSIGGQTFRRHNARSAEGANPAFPNNPPMPASTTDQSPGTLTSSGAQDDTLQYPFLPLVHLDRMLVSPAELLHVAATRPHRLTQQYFLSQSTPLPTGPSRRLAYTANWLDVPDAYMPAAPPPTPPTNSTFLLRALDYLRPGPYTEGMPSGGRVPGRVNINTIPRQSPQTMLAVADVGEANRFTQQDVFGSPGPVRGYLNLITDATTGRSPTPTGLVDENDRPFFGSAHAIGIDPNIPPRDRTLYRRNGFYQLQQNDEDFSPTRAILPIGATAGTTYQKYELLSKAVNQLTTRSNTFAVYLTVGYFEVKNPGPYNDTNRPILGRELGTDLGAVTRHRFFSVIDRTNLTVEQTGPATLRQGQAPIFLKYEPDLSVPPGYNPATPAGPYPAAPFVVPDPDLRVAPLPAPAGYVVTAPPINPATNAAVAVRIPATGVFPPNATVNATAQYPPAAPVATRSVSGVYDGVPWTLYDGSQIEIGVGDRKEVVTVRLPVNALEQGAFGEGTARIVLVANGPTFQFPHYRGATMRIVDPGKTGFQTFLGNPGPQPGFNYKSSRYASVVRYFEELK
jgi:hypothetical protein